MYIPRKIKDRKIQLNLLSQPFLPCRIIHYLSFVRYRLIFHLQKHSKFSPGFLVACGWIPRRSVLALDQVTLVVTRS